MVSVIKRSVPLAHEETIRLIRQKLGLKPIVLIGMMGSGKSCSGMSLANALGYPFFDSDKVIEKQANMTISEIFETYGEDFFREKEKTVIIDLIKRNHGIIATGGGAFMNQTIRDYCQKEALVLWFDTKLSALMSRLERNKTRPLLQTENPTETIKNLLEIRSPFYETADIKVDTSDLSHDQVVAQSVEQLAHHLSRENL